jgi:hypothetical protein
MLGESKRISFFLTIFGNLWAYWKKQALVAYGIDNRVGKCDIGVSFKNSSKDI